MRSAKPYVLLLSVLAGVVWWALWTPTRSRTRSIETPAAREASGGGARPLVAPAAGPRRASEPVPSAAPLAAAAEDAAEADAQAAELSRLRGRLLDAETEEPLDGYRLELLPAFRRGAGTAATTDVEGRFELTLEPGEYLVLHRAEPGSGARALAREVVPTRCEVPRATGDEPEEALFHARRPSGELEVEVTFADGRPAAGAQVWFTCRMEAEPLVDHGNRTDDAGRARLGVWQPLDFDDGLLLARDDVGNVAEPLAVAAPLAPGVRRLVLLPGAAVALRVIDHDGRPAAGRRVLLASDLALGERLYRETDAEGRQHFEGLASGAWSLGVELPDEDRWERRPLELLRGETRDVEVVLAAPDEPLAVAGVVVDEEDAPLADVDLPVTVDGRRSGLVRTDAEGRFRLHARGGKRVWVGANALQQGDRFEPEAIEAEFGADWLLFRRVERARSVSFEVEVHDRVTGSELEHFVAAIDRGPESAAWGDSYAPRRRFELRLLPDARFTVKSRGYVSRALDLLPAVERLAPGERLRVELEPGLDHAFQVLDLDTLEPLADVLLRSPTAGEARTDASGRVRLRSDAWSVYRMTKAGYEAEDWDPETDLLWGRGPFFMVRR